MILIRHEPGAGGVHRLVLLGRLERSDAPGLAAVPASLPVGTVTVRLLLAKLWPEGPEPVGALLALARFLAATGVEPVFVGADAELAEQLRREGDQAVVGPGPDDVRAAGSWTGTPLPRLVPAQRGPLTRSTPAVPG